MVGEILFAAAAGVEVSGGFGERLGGGGEFFVECGDGFVAFGDGAFELGDRGVEVGDGGIEFGDLGGGGGEVAGELRGDLFFVGEVADESAIIDGQFIVSVVGVLATGLGDTEGCEEKTAGAEGEATAAGGLGIG